MAPVLDSRRKLVWDTRLHVGLVKTQVLPECKVDPDRSSVIMYSNQPSCFAWTHPYIFMLSFKIFITIFVIH